MTQKMVAPSFTRLTCNFPPRLAVVYPISQYIRFSLESKRKIRYMENNSQVGILTRLKGKQGSVAGREICVAMTHLKSKEGNEERRLQQGKILLKALEDLVGQSNIPVFILGVLMNFSRPSLPHLQHAHFLLLSLGKINIRTLMTYPVAQCITILRG